MKNKSKNKILIFDGISFLFLGHQIYEAFQNIGIEAEYIDPKKFQEKIFYKARRAWNRKMDKVFRGNEYSSFPRLSTSAEKRMHEKIEKFSPNIILVVGFSHRFVSDGFWRKIKENTQCRLVLFDTESGNFFSSEPAKLVYFINNEIKKYDKVLSFSKEITSYLRGLNIFAEYFPFGFSSKDTMDLFYPEEKDICFVGGANIRRLFVLEKIKHHNLIVYGASWKKYKPIMSKELREKTVFKDIFGEDLIRALKSSKIILNITNLNFWGISSGINLRVAEAMSLNCFMLTDYTEELEGLFVIGTEIEAYKSYSDLTEKLNYYLSNEKQRLNIAKQGYLKYKEKYTWEKRLNDFLLGMDA